MSEDYVYTFLSKYKLDQPVNCIISFDDDEDIPQHDIKNKVASDDEESIFENDIITLSEQCADNNLNIKRDIESNDVVVVSTYFQKDIKKEILDAQEEQQTKNHSNSDTVVDNKSIEINTNLQDKSFNDTVSDSKTVIKKEVIIELIDDKIDRYGRIATDAVVNNKAIENNLYLSTSKSFVENIRTNGQLNSSNTSSNECNLSTNKRRKLDNYPSPESGKITTLKQPETCATNRPNNKENYEKIENVVAKENIHCKQNQVTAVTTESNKAISNLLRTLSLNLIFTLDVYARHNKCNSDLQENQKQESIQFYFNNSYSAMETVFLSASGNENNSDLIRKFLDDTAKFCNSKFSLAQIESCFYQMMGWANSKRNKGESIKISNGADPSIQSHQLSMPDISWTNNDDNRQNVAREQSTNSSTVLSNALDPDPNPFVKPPTTCIYSSGVGISIAIDSSILSNVAKTKDNTECNNAKDSQVIIANNFHNSKNNTLTTNLDANNSRTQINSAKQWLSSVNSMDANPSLSHRDNCLPVPTNVSGARHTLPTLQKLLNQQSPKVSPLWLPPVNECDMFNESNHLSRNEERENAKRNCRRKVKTQTLIDQKNKAPNLQLQQQNNLTGQQTAPTVMEQQNKFSRHQIVPTAIQQQNYLSSQQNVPTAVQQQNYYSQQTRPINMEQRNNLYMQQNDLYRQQTAQSRLDQQHIFSRQYTQPQSKVESQNNYKQNMQLSQNKIAEIQNNIYNHYYASLQREKVANQPSYSDRQVVQHTQNERRLQSDIRQPNPEYHSGFVETRNHLSYPVPHFQPDVMSQQNNTHKSMERLQAQVERQNIRRPSIPPVPNDAWQLNYYRPEGQDKQNQIEISRSLSRDSGIMSPLYLNSPDTQNTTGTDNIESPAPMITHVTSLNPSASYIVASTCSICHTNTNLKCIGCFKVYYCSYSCQKRDWPAHQNDCR